MSVFEGHSDGRGESFVGDFVAVEMESIESEWRCDVCEGWSRLDSRI